MKIVNFDNGKRYAFAELLDLGELLVSSPNNTVFNFTFDTEVEIKMQGEATGWHAAKITEIFDDTDGVLAFGYYGGGTTLAIGLELLYGMHTEKMPPARAIANQLIKWINDHVENFTTADTICLEIDEANESYIHALISKKQKEEATKEELPPLDTNFDNCTNDELGDFWAFVSTVIDLEEKGLINFTEGWDRDNELAELFRESYRKWPYSEMGYGDFIEDFLIFKQSQKETTENKYNDTVILGKTKVEFLNNTLNITGTGVIVGVETRKSDNNEACYRVCPTKYLNEPSWQEHIVSVPDSSLKIIG